MLNVPDVRIGERGDFVLKRHARFFGVVDTHLRDLLSPMTVLFRRLSYAPLSVSSLSLSLSLFFSSGHFIVQNQRADSNCHSRCVRSSRDQSSAL
jgi:hypothetical protein